ncbi:unnamed protein product [Linum tenue]|uniref:Ribosomal protein L23 n=1 Tax=Linum tenue TaxID=586396 RepID=A0AAV0S189_9ROSI|nr:unnamed protein product [Linum tenue]
MHSTDRMFLTVSFDIETSIIIKRNKMIMSNYCYWPRSHKKRNS